MKDHVILLVSAILGCLNLSAAVYEPAGVTPPKPLREFRGVWVATVGNIDWPSRKDLTSTEQKAELITILDRAAQLKLNTVIFQVRPSCDALYASKIEPWSEYLTGAMGKRPEPFYDPLAFAVEEAHKRGLELHAWFNPYRARHLSAKSPIVSSHISKTRPQLVKQYGKDLWLDPGEKEVQDYSLSVVLDVVKRYDVDGIHFDDYFYPYKVKDASDQDLDFPDGSSWQRFGKKTRMSRDDWRRENVNAFIQRVYKAIKEEKPWVKFGISPFGIWRPGNPQQIEGYDAYAKLYADSRRWLNKGWLDYFAPQLYWRIEPKEQSFPVLLKWWSNQNSKGRLLVSGMNSAVVGRTWKPEEIINQIRLTRKEPAAGGHVHWNMKSLMAKNGLAEALEREVYTQPALVPALPWLGRCHLEKPRLAAGPGEGEGRVQVSWSLAGTEPVAHWLFQARSGNEWRTEILPGNTTGLTWRGPAPQIIAVAAVDRNGNLSPTVAVQAKK